MRGLDSRFIFANWYCSFDPYDSVKMVRGSIAHFSWRGANFLPSFIGVNVFGRRSESSARQLDQVLMVVWPDGLSHQNIAIATRPS